MDKNDFYGKYRQMEECIYSTLDGNSRVLVINGEVVRLLTLLSNNRTKVKTLIPNLSMGELALCSNDGVGYTVSEEVKCVLEKQKEYIKIYDILEDFLECDIQNQERNSL